jgi:hypothetical protein
MRVYGSSYEIVPDLRGDDIRWNLRCRKMCIVFLTSFGTDERLYYLVEEDGILKRVGYNE